jgi:thioredoxin-related protein
MDPRRRLALACLAAGATAASLARAQVPDLYGARRDPAQHFFTPSLGSLKADLAEARRLGKRAALIVFLSDDCPDCARMRREVLSLSGVQDYFRRQFAPLAVDARGAAPIADFAGRPTTGRDFAASQSVARLPAFVFYDLDGKALARFEGEIRDAGEFVRLGEFVASGAYRTSTFAEYRDAASSRRIR